MGWGLWLLSELVRVTRGSLWLWSGNAAYGFDSDGTSESTIHRSPGAVWPSKSLCILIKLREFFKTRRQLG